MDIAQAKFCTYHYFNFLMEGAHGTLCRLCDGAVDISQVLMQYDFLYKSVVKCSPRHVLFSLYICMVTNTHCKFSLMPTTKIGKRCSFCCMVTNTYCKFSLMPRSAYSIFI